jgi:hypothetical protein
VTATRAGYKVVVSAAVEPEQRDELVRRAIEGDRTLSQELRIAVREHLEHPSGLRRRASVPPEGPAVDIEDT